MSITSVNLCATAFSSALQEASRYFSSSCLFCWRYSSQEFYSVPPSSSHALEPSHLSRTIRNCPPLPKLCVSLFSSVFGILSCWLCPIFQGTTLFLISRLCMCCVSIWRIFLHLVSFFHHHTSLTCLAPTAP